ncbi:hypothetical protein L1887_18920 [Cichorium endivia]|nr:hypothetical protein L1887_18920 [Cichorium endivia]
MIMKIVIEDDNEEIQRVISTTGMKGDRWKFNPAEMEKLKEMYKVLKVFYKSNVLFPTVGVLDFVIKTSIKKALSKVSEDSNAHVVLKKQLNDLYFMIDTNLLYRSGLVDHRVRTVLKNDVQGRRNI